jgi:ribosomal protein S18 acetylase RimI-like enzyme
VARLARLVELARRVFEVVPVDVLEWRTTNEVPTPTQIEDAAVHPISREETQWRDALPSDRSKKVESFFARGDQGYVATVGGEFAGWTWLSRVSHRDPWSGLRIRVARDEAYAYATLVEEPYRPLGIAAVLVSRLLSDVQKDPAMSRVYGWVDCRNREAQALYRMMFGFTQVQRVRRVHLPRAGLQLPWSDDPKFGPVSRVGRHSTVA